MSGAALRSGEAPDKFLLTCPVQGVLPSLLAVVHYAGPEMPCCRCLWQLLAFFLFREQAGRLPHGEESIHLEQWRPCVLSLPCSSQDLKATGLTEANKQELWNSLFDDAASASASASTSAATSDEQEVTGCTCASPSCLRHTAQKLLFEMSFLSGLNIQPTTLLPCAGRRRQHQWRTSARRDGS